MIKSLELSNFGGYRSLRLDFAPLTVIIGSNAYGKSTLLHAISMLMAGVDVATRHAPADNSARWLVRGEPLDTIAPSAGGWQKLFTRTQDSPAEHLLVQGTFEGLRWLSKARLTVAKVPEGKPDVVVAVESNTPEARPPASSRGASATLITHVSTLDHDEVYVPDEGLQFTLRSGARAGFVRNRLIRLDEAAIERINRVLRKLAQAEIVSMTRLADAQTGAPLTVSFRRNGSTFELSSANHALVSALSLLSEVEAQLAQPSESGERLLLLDEPELHLHPRAQAVLAECLSEISSSVGVQIVSVTHSHPIVRSLLSHPNSAVITIERQFTHLRRLYSQKDVLRALRNTHDLATFSAVNFLASRHVLFVEGETDETILEQCDLAHFSASPERLARFESWTRVPLDGVSNAPAPELIERLVSSPILPRLNRGEVLVVASVLDRDYDREPGHHLRSGPQVERIDHVWSRHSIESLFIDVDVLESLLLVTLGVGAPADLRDRIQAAIAAADSDGSLREGAEDELAEFFRRTRQHTSKAAQAEARKRVRTDPGIWQRGKDRAAFVLQHVRATLPLPLQNKVRGSIHKLLEAIPVEDLRRVKVPAELISLLDELVTRAA